MAKKAKFSLGKTIVFSLVSLVVGALIGAGSNYLYLKQNIKSDSINNQSIKGVVYDDFQIHFLELGNIYTGDSIYIKAGDNDILIDAGSRSSSAKTISEYVDRYCTDGKLEYVIATHAHQDHIAGFGGANGILAKYDVDTIIDFAGTSSNSGVYKSYVSARDAKIANGTKHYTALDCWNETNGATRRYDLGEDMYFEVLYNYYYFDENKASTENDNSVITMFTYGSHKFLLTGDLEESGENKMVEYYTSINQPLPKVDVFKAGHHGSKTSSNDALLAMITPDISVVTCVAGSTEYTTNSANTFPTQAYINRISQYTKEVYVTSLCIDYEKGEYQSMNGDIIVSSNKKKVAVAGSNNNTVLKDTDWFKENRTTPEAWL